MLGDGQARTRLAALVVDLGARVTEVETALDGSAQPFTAAELESTNAALIRCRDALWALGRDRLRAAEQVSLLAAGDPSDAGLAVLFSVHQAFSALDRLEVRGRDSAGIEVQLTGHGLDPSDPVVAQALASRSDLLFTTRSARLVDGVLVVVYKAAAEIGELGDNTASLRAELSSDHLLELALSSPDVEGVVLGHTRWASIGIISEPNAHPQCSDEIGRVGGALSTAVLNGDVDNFADLTVADGLEPPAEITTDAKVIPTLMSRRLDEGLEAREAFRETVASMVGSIAIGLRLQPRLDRRIAEQLSESSELLWVRFGRLRQRRSGDQQSGERDDQKQPSAHVGATACHSLTSRTCNASLLRMRGQDTKMSPPERRMRVLAWRVDCHLSSRGSTVPERTCHERASIGRP